MNWIALSLLVRPPCHPPPMNSPTQLHRRAVLPRLLPMSTGSRVFTFSTHVTLLLITLRHCNISVDCFTDNRLEDLQEKYSQEVEERRRLESELKLLQVKVSTLFILFVFLCLCFST